MQHVIRIHGDNGVVVTYREQADGSWQMDQPNPTLELQEQEYKSIMALCQYNLSSGNERRLATIKVIRSVLPHLGLLQAKLAYEMATFILHEGRPW